MKNLPVIFTAIAAAFCLIILGLYLYQTAPENNTPNLSENSQDAVVIMPDIIISDDQPVAADDDDSSQISSSSDEEGSYQSPPLIQTMKPKQKQNS